MATRIVRRERIHMKRKAIVLLSSVLAGALLVGGAFAGYAVTDNADPFGINVTPGNLDVDDTDYITLKWGQGTNLENISLLKVGENRKVGTLNLVAEGKKAYENGIFTLTLEDKSGTKEATDPKLFDYLNVYVYDGDQNLGENGVLPSVVAAKQILKSTAAESDGKKHITWENITANASGKEISVFVNLDESASPIYDSIQADKLYLEVDWNAKTGDVSTGTVVYFQNNYDWEHVYAYAWKGEKVNALWPGVEMVNVYDDVYRLSIPNDSFGSVVFTSKKDGATVEDHTKTADLDLSSFNATTPCYNFSGWVEVPEEEVKVSVTATVNGEAAVLEDVKPGTSSDRGHYILDLAKDDVVAFKDGLTTIHFFHYDSEQGKSFDDGTSFVAPAAHKYIFYYNDKGEMYHAEYNEPVYYLVGFGDKWGIADGIQLEKVDDNHYQKANVVFDKTELVKVTDGDTGWFGVATTYTDCGYTVGSSGNAQVAEGTYTVHLFLNSSDGNFLRFDVAA